MHIFELNYQPHMMNYTETENNMEISVWLLVIVLSGNTIVVDNLSSKSECTILEAKMRILYTSNIRYADCYSVKKIK